MMDLGRYHAAAEAFQTAAEMGNAPAAMCLAMMHSTPDGRFGEMFDLPEAEFWAQQVQG
jgi:hypothetical protein